MASSNTATVAVASNFALPAKELQKTFEKQSPYKIRLSFSSSGKFYAQIYNGAPFDIFLSADQLKPAKLVAEGLASASTLRTYAIGQLVLWAPGQDLSIRKQVALNMPIRSGLASDATANPSSAANSPTVAPLKIKVPRYLLDVQNTPEATSRTNQKKIAVANARLAPYGLAAQQVLTQLALLQPAQHNLARGENINQTYHFVFSGNASMGFVAQSQLRMNDIESKSIWRVPPQLHEPILQDGILLKRAEYNAAAHAFWEYLSSDEARSIIEHYGYKLPTGKRDNH